jgi:hypothetical protein
MDGEQAGLRSSWGTLHNEDYGHSGGDRTPKGARNGTLTCQIAQVRSRPPSGQSAGSCSGVVVPTS